VEYQPTFITFLAIVLQDFPRRKVDHTNVVPNHHQHPRQRSGSARRRNRVESDLTFFPEIIKRLDGTLRISNYPTRAAKTILNWPLTLTGVHSLNRPPQVRDA